MSSTHTAAPGDVTQTAAPPHVLPACPACGAIARRAAARFCATCGRALRESDYLPTDTLRASYHHQYNHPPLMPGHAPHPTCVLRPAVRLSVKGWYAPPDGTTRLARAFVAYALIPYLGILFCPGAVLLGGVGVLRAWRAPRGNARRPARCAVRGLVIFAAQLFLWWVLLQIPQWARR